MITHKLSQKADLAQSRYKSMTDTWQALYGRALTSPDFGYGGQSQAVIEQAYEIAREYLSAEMAFISSVLFESAIEAQGLASRKFTNNVSDLLAIEAQTHLGETQSYIRDEITTQINRDIAGMRISLQRVVLDVSMISRTRKMKTQHALIGWRLQNDETLGFNFTDRRGHKTPSAKFIRGLWRQTMLSVHNETVLMTLVDYEQTQAAVLKMEEGVEQRIDTISLTGEGLSYSEIRTQLFHPNSNAYLGAV